MQSPVQLSTQIIPLIVKHSLKLVATLKLPNLENGYNNKYDIGKYAFSPNPFNSLL